MRKERQGKARQGMATLQEEGDMGVIIVGAGPSGLATAACLNRLSISNILLEREDCFASLWKKKSYDRLHLHLPKQFCQLPHMSFPTTYPTYVSRKQFLHYLDEYVSRFTITPLYHRWVDSASYDQATQKWKVKARNIINAAGVEEYRARFLVVATGETSDPFIPEVEGLDTFTGQVIHSTQYKSGESYCDQNVLVVGSGNSGMEIALDLSNHAANTSIAVRSPLHILSTDIMYLAMILLNYIPLDLVETLVVMLSENRYGGLAKYGITRPQEGPFTLKAKHGKYPVIDTGTYSKIKSGEIQVFPGITSIKGNDVAFTDGKSHSFDAIVFATGFRRSINEWLQDDKYLLDQDGIPKPPVPNHWKGENGLYCAGLARRGLYGAASDAQNIANHIKSLL